MLLRARDVQIGAGLEAWAARVAAPEFPAVPATIDEIGFTAANDRAGPGAPFHSVVVATCHNDVVTDGGIVFATNHGTDIARNVSATAENRASPSIRLIEAAAANDAQMTPLGVNAPSPITLKSFRWS